MRTGKTGVRMAKGLVREREKAMGYLEVTGKNNYLCCGLVEI